MIRLAVRCAASDAAAVLAELSVLAPAGLEQVDLDDGVEYAVYGAEGELPDLGEGPATIGGRRVQVDSRAVPDDWADRWREFHRAVDIGPIRVRPPWEPTRDGALDVVIDPGRAFGTAAHPTTRLCIELLAERTPRGSLADWGTGSGVVAIAAARLGYRQIAACDSEPVAVAAAQANAHANGVELELTRCDVGVDDPPPGDVAIANLLAPVLRTLCGRFERGEVQRPSQLIASGLLARERGGLAARFAKAGLRVADGRESEGWCALRLVDAAS